MSKSKRKRCKSEDCDNLVITGKYCEYCTKKRKEARSAFAARFGGIGATLVMAGVAIHKLIKFLTKR